jgi:hypothetical protein
LKNDCQQLFMLATKLPKSVSHIHLNVSNGRTHLHVPTLQQSAIRYLNFFILPVDFGKEKKVKITFFDFLSVSKIKRQIKPTASPGC